MWICKIEPNVALLKLGVYECSNCHKTLIALSEDEANTKQPSISNYIFCPYCGKEHNKK